jgi:PAS domain S-box-containing protein
VGYAWLNLDGGFVGASPDFCELLDWPRADLIGRSLSDIFPLAAIDEINAAIQQMIAGGAVESHLHEVALGRTGPFFLLDLALRRRNMGGPLAKGLLVSISDITPLKQAQQSLRESEELFQSVFQNSRLGFYRTTPDGEILMVNPAICEMLGYDSVEDLKKVNLQEEDYTALGRRNDFRRHMETEGSVVGFEAAWKRSDGSKIIVRENARAVRDNSGKLIYYDGTVEDITAPKGAEEALRESEERLRQAMQAGRMYAFEWDATTDRVARSGDPEILNTLSASPDDTGAKFMLQVHPDDRDRFQSIACGMTADRPLYQITYRMIRDDRMYWIEERGRGFFDSKGEILRVIGVAADVTQRKHDEETLRELGGRLLKAQEEERVRIARELHDDIGQELALLEIRLQTALNNGDKMSGKWSEFQHHVGLIGQKVRSLSHQLHSDELEFLGLAVAVEGLSRTIAENYNIEVLCTIDKTIPRALPGNIALCFYRLVQEALQNVIRHSGAKQVHVRLSGGVTEVVASVTDTGCGFDPQNRTVAEGLGIISMQERMHSIGGYLSLRSNPGKGTTVEGRVPLGR